MYSWDLFSLLYTSISTCTAEQAGFSGMSKNGQDTGMLVLLALLKTPHGQYGTAGASLPLCKWSAHIALTATAVLLRRAGRATQYQQVGCAVDDSCQEFVGKADKITSAPQSEGDWATPSISSALLRDCWYRLNSGTGTTSNTCCVRGLTHLLALSLSALNLLPAPLLVALIIVLGLDALIPCAPPQAPAKKGMTLSPRCRTPCAPPQAAASVSWLCRVADKC